MEVGNALSTYDRHKVAAFIQKCYKTDNISIVNITLQLFEQGLNLYESRSDKKWGLVDCLSFIVMEQQKLIDAVTSDIHFYSSRFSGIIAIKAFSNSLLVKYRFLVGAFWWAIAHLYPK